MTPPPPAARVRRSGSLRLRLLIGTLGWISVSIVVAGWALTRLFDEHVQRQLDAELGAHLNQLAAQLTLAADGRPGLRLPLSDPRFARPYSGLYWQVDVLATAAAPARPAALRSRSLWDASLTVPADRPADGERHSHRTEGPDGAPLRLTELVLHPAEHPEQALRLLVAANEALVREPVERFTGLLALALGLLAAGLVVAAVVQVRVGLRPLASLRDSLADVRAGRRKAIDAPFPAEVQPLVDEFNGVLARNAEIVERARTQAGNLAHAVKTPLAVLANAAAAGEGPLARLVAEQVALARSQVDYHLARSRAAAAAGIPGQRTAVAPVIDGLLRLMSRVHAERRLDLPAADCPADATFLGEQQDLQEMLGNLLDNACKWATSTVRVAVRAEGGQLLLQIDDDGPGLPPGTAEAVLARGVRADERTPGSGLGLAIVHDLAVLYGGDIVLGASPLGGVRASLRLPGA